MNLQTVNGADGASSKAGASATPNDAGLTDRFMKLLVAQMNNQDPLNPLDNAQITSQLAQINTVVGVNQLNTTVNGLGERTGNAPLEEVVMALHQLYQSSTGIQPYSLAAISQAVAAASCRPIPVNKPIVGAGIFTHESGIHVSGLLRDPANYQSLDPHALGRNHELVLGKHSGTDAVRWGYANGIVQGTTATKFAPNAPVTREQLAVMLSRYADCTGVLTPDGVDLSDFADANRISPYAQPAMSWAVAKGLLVGTSTTTLSPKGTATRAQLATVLMRFYTLAENS